MSKHIVFDLDGTLIDSKPEILETYATVFDALPPQEAVDLHSISLTATLQATLEGVYRDSFLVERAKALFAGIYDHSHFNSTLLYAGVPETLNALHEGGWRMYIATNKRLAPTLRILERKGIARFFSTVKASDQIAGKTTSKEDMVRAICKEQDVERGWMVGDGIKDVEAGQVCGLATVAVSYGYEKKDELIEKKPTFVIDSFSELINIINY